MIVKTVVGGWIDYDLLTSRLFTDAYDEVLILILYVPLGLYF